MRRHLPLAAFAVLVAAPALSAEGDSSEPCILQPTLGRPVFVAPGGTFDAQFHGAAATESAGWRLVRGDGLRTYELQATPIGGGVRLSLSPETPPATYDLEWRLAGQTVRSPHCVAVGRVDRQIRLVHLSNMNVGDVSAPDFEPALLDEINLISPTAIIATGDYLDAAHPDPPGGWRRLVDFLSRFEAPVLMACGDHDNVALYSRYAAGSPIGSVQIGAFRGFVLCDHGLAAIERDPEQVRWLESMLLERPAPDGLTFIVAHDQRPNLLAEWLRRDVLKEVLTRGRLGLWFAGGHRDWDGREYRELVDAAAPLLYVRTHEASGAVREGAAGVAHYRVIDMIDNRVLLPAEAAGGEEPPPSLGVGRLRWGLDGPNDGSRTRLLLEIINNHPFRLDRLGQTLRLKKVEGQRPWCRGGSLLDVADLGALWECRVRADLPDKGVARVLVGSGPAPAPLSAIVRFSGPTQLVLAPRRTAEGLFYAAAQGATPTVTIQNSGSTAIEITPLIRLDGDSLAYRPEEAAGAASVTRARVHLSPGESLSLRLDFSALRVRPGRRELQVYTGESEPASAACFPLTVEGMDDSAGEAVAAGG